MTQPNAFALRVEKPLMAKFKVVAAEHSRSINKEIVMLIKQAVQAYEKENGPIEIPTDDDEY